jgi:hypothetical protein
VKRRQSPHTDWCARDHRCNLAEHRAPSLTIHLDGGGVGVGQGHAQRDVGVFVSGGGFDAGEDRDPAARRQLAALLADTRTMIGRAGALARPKPRRAA